MKLHGGTSHIFTNCVRTCPVQFTYSLLIAIKDRHVGPEHKFADFMCEKAAVLEANQNAKLDEVTSCHTLSVQLRTCSSPSCSVCIVWSLAGR